MRDLVQGVPVLFVPGNAGAFDQVASFPSLTNREPFPHIVQVRSIGSVSARMTGDAAELAKFAQYNQETYRLEASHASFDFFALHFHEELSAFSGQLLYEQADYVNACIRCASRPSLISHVRHSLRQLHPRSV